MGGMAGGAGLLSKYGRMDSLRCRDLFAYLGMAFETEILSGSGKELLIRRSVRVVARRAPGEDRRVNHFLLHLLLNIGMTDETDLSGVLQKERFVIGFVGVMTRCAIPCRGRAVDILVIHLVRVAGKTELFQRLGEELRFVRGVRTMTERARAVLNRHVHVFLAPEGRVAHIAERRHILDEFERLFPLLGMRGKCCLVARLARLGNRVQGFSLQHLRMAVSVDAPFFRRGLRVK